MNPNPPPRTIALVLNPYPVLSARVMEGIAGYARKLGNWRFRVTGTDTSALGDWLEQVQPDGIIAHVGQRGIGDRVKAVGVPVVNTSGNTAHDDIPSVYTDVVRIGRLGAEHFLERGFRHVGFCGCPLQFAQRRREAFAAALAQAGRECLTHEPPWESVAGCWRDTTGGIERWLAQAPKPLGVMACHDVVAVEVLDLCRRIGAAPEQVAVLGVDNDTTICECGTPALSSVDANVARNGYEAAALLDALLRGQPPPAEPVVTTPWGVVARQSTDVIACEDRDLASALRFIASHACEGIDVEAVLEQSAVSRRTLERRFRNLLGRSPRDEIRRVRLQHARVLLAETDLPVADVAARCGFEHLSHLSLAIKQETGLPPSAYRQRFRHR